MRTYEHYVLPLMGPLGGPISRQRAAEELDQMSEQGWTLVCVDKAVAYFRRPVIEGRK